MMLALVAAALLRTALPTAEPPKPDRDAPQADERVAAAAFARATEIKDFAVQIGELDAVLAKLPRPTRYRGMVQCYRGWVLSELGRAADSDAAIEECYRLRPDDSYAIWEMSSVVLARRDVRRGARLLIAAIRADPAPLADYDPEAMASTLRQLSHVREEGLRAELLKALAGTEFGKDDPAWTSRQAVDAIDGLLAAGDRDGAVRMLPLVLVPRLGLQLLVDRRYEAIWPDVEAWAGGDLRAQRDAYVAAAKASFDIDPSLHLRRNYADALAAAGRVDQAKALLREAVDNSALWDADRFGVTIVAIRLAGLIERDGDVDGALGVLRKLKAGAPPGQFEYVANVVPNEARLLVAAKRYGEALALLDRETPPLAKVEGPAALGVFHALRSCALRGLGRAAEAEVAALAARYAGDAEAERLARACGDQRREREQWLEAVQSPASRSQALVALLAIERDARAQAALERFGRPLPPSFADAIAGWRAPGR